MTSCPDATPEGAPCPGNVHHRTEDEWVIYTCDTCGTERSRHVQTVDPASRIRLRLQQANLPSRFVGVRFAEDLENGPALEVLRSWIDSYDASEPDRRLASLLPAPALFGLAGRGKTHLLVALCVRLIRECDVTVAFYSVRGLLRELQRFEDTAAREQTWRRTVGVDVLALDDVGAQQVTDWRHDQLADLVDERYERELPIVLATNFPPSLWEQRMDERTVSRLRGMTVPVELRGVDRREHTSMERG